MTRVEDWDRALDESCIKKTRTKKPLHTEEWSWKTRPHHRRIIFPDVVFQGSRSVCAFCAFTSSAQMELNAKIAQAQGASCNIKFLWESLLTRVLQLHGFEEEHGKEARKELEKKLTADAQTLTTEGQTLTTEGQTLTTEGQTYYEMDDALGWCFKHLGVNAEVDHDVNPEVYHDEKKKAVASSANKNFTAEEICKRFVRLTGEDELEDKDEAKSSRLMTGEDELEDKDKAKSSRLKKSIHNLGIKDYRCYEMLTANEVWEYVEAGRAVLATVLAGGDFDELEKDEIYAWIPHFDLEKKEWLDEPGKHAVVLVGNGDPGPEMNFEQFHAFLNSYGIHFADGGVGCIFYKALFIGYCLIEIDAKPKHIFHTLADLDHVPRPKIRKCNAIPSPDCTSLPRPLPAVTTPSPPQGPDALPSQLPPAHPVPWHQGPPPQGSSSRYVPPALRDRLPTSPKKRW